MVCRPAAAPSLTGSLLDMQDVSLHPGPAERTSALWHDPQVICRHVKNEERWTHSCYRRHRRYCKGRFPCCLRAGSTGAEDPSHFRELSIVGARQSSGSQPRPSFLQVCGTGSPIRLSQQKPGGGGPWRNHQSGVVGLDCSGFVKFFFCSPQSPVRILLRTSLLKTRDVLKKQK